MGEVDDETGIVKNLSLCTIDTVLNPSIGEMVTADGNRFVNGILESKQFVCNVHGEITERKFEAFEKRVAKMPKTHISSKKAEFLGKAITDFFSSLV